MLHETNWSLQNKCYCVRTMLEYPQQHETPKHYTKKSLKQTFFFWSVTFMLLSLQLLVWKTDLHLNLKVDERWRRGGEFIKGHYNNDEAPIFLKFLCVYFNKWWEYWCTYHRKKILTKKIHTRWLLFLADLMLLSQTKVSNHSFAHRELHYILGFTFPRENLICKHRQVFFAQYRVRQGWNSPT